MKSNAATAPGGMHHMETIAVVVAAISTAVLAFANLGKPSLWHDELVHVYVAKKILETGLPLLLSGRVFTNGTLFNYLLAATIAGFGDGEAAVRSISAVFGIVNVVLTYRVLRTLIGGPAAALTALLMAWSPWQIAWARQARFYMVHQTIYLALMSTVWRYGQTHHDVRRSILLGTGAIGLYLVGLLAGPQTIFFLGPIGVYAICRWIAGPGSRWRWAGLAVACGALATTTLLGYYLALPRAEHDAIFKEALRTATPDGALVDHDQSDALYYFRFYTNNLGTGFFILSAIGFALLAGRGGWRGIFVSLAFVVPLLVLNFLLVHDRRYRFLFFAYPFYVAAGAYAIGQLTRFVRRSRRSAWRMAVSALIIGFAARLTISEGRLAGDCIAVASGDNTTLAVHHPQWRKPCAYVKARSADAAVLCTTYITALYYVGRVDDWYPSRVIVWEYIESGMDGMKSLTELKEFVARHPRGYFIAEQRRFNMWPFFKDDVAWVEANMRKIDEASNSDITVYAWGTNS